MNNASVHASGKSHRDENFPVASLIAPRYREAVLAFYHFVRTADDVADHPTLTPENKILLLDDLEHTLLGKIGHTNHADKCATTLAHILATHKITPRHALDLLAAFRLDVTKSRYASFDELMDYCRLSAMPVGRYMLDLHGESESTWPASDALCAALQIINHLQDCGKDYRDLDRVYLPQDGLFALGAAVEMLGADHAAPPLRAAMQELTVRTEGLLRESAGFSDEIRDTRLAMNVAAIQKLAQSLTRTLHKRDPLSQKIHASKPVFAAITFSAAASAALRRASPFARRSAARSTKQ